MESPYLREHATSRIGAAVLACASLAVVLVGALAAPVGGTGFSPGSRLALTGSAVSPSTVITIGVGAALSHSPEMGWPQVNAVQLAVNQINAAGGITIAGTPATLAVVHADDGCNPVQAENAAQSLIGGGAVAVVGYTCSRASQAAAPIHDAAGVAMISPSSTGRFVTEAGHTTTFRTTSRDDRVTEHLPAYLGGAVHLQRAAILELTSFYSNWTTDTVSDTFTGQGGEVTGVYRVDTTDEFTATLAAIKHDHPDVIFYADVNPAHAGLLSKAAHGRGMDDVPIAWITFSDDASVLAAYAAAAGAATAGDYAAMFYRQPQDMPGFPAFGAAYTAAGFPNFGDKATANSAFAYDAAGIIIAAIRSCQCTDPAAVRDAIAATHNFPGVVGLYQGFDAKGDAVPQWGWLEHHTGGQWVSLYPGRLYLPLVRSAAATP